MEKHRCKLCLKSFVNGRALGGHMRSHMLNLPVPSKVEEPMNQPSQESDAASAPYSSSSSDEEEEEEEKKGQFYGLRENPKRSVRMVDPEFVDAGSAVIQDRESETESSRNLTRRRSKRTRKILDRQQQDDDDDDEAKKLKANINQQSKTESWVEAEPEPVSSISDPTTEEDVAFCLMMLSRDQWKSKACQDNDEDDDDEEDEEEESDESEGYIKLSKVNNRTARAKYRCETCNKVFKSYQALGGHRASHKKIKAYPPAATRETELKPENVARCSMTEKKVHECPVCFRVFPSGQALGGHKRSHVTGQVAAATTRTAVKCSKNSMIDLNLPAPVDDDDASQIELSAVSDAEFVK